MNGCARTRTAATMDRQAIDTVGFSRTDDAADAGAVQRIGRRENDGCVVGEKAWSYQPSKSS